MPRALFTVFSDETSSQPSSSTSAPIAAPRIRRRNLENSDEKENGNDSAIALTPRAIKPRIDRFNGKQPFGLASPPANGKEAAQQRLGLGFASDGNSSTMRGPAKRTIGRKAGRQMSGKLKEEFAMDTQYIEPPVEIDVTDGVLANVTEAYTGSNGFHLSPQATVREQLDSS